jgi:hypothetical protein
VVERGRELAVPVADQEFELACVLVKVHEKVPGLLDGPDPGRMRSDAQDVHGPGLDLHHEQHRQALEEDRVYVHEVIGKDAGCLGCQELSPGGRRPPWRGTEPGSG